MVERTPRFSLQQIGTGAVRFPSGAPIPSISDASVDPYFRTRTPKDVHVEAILFWPQEKGMYPGIVLLHERWGLNTQIKDVANRLACEGYLVIVPNLYGRQGGMVTANAEVADALAARVKEADLLQDINSCCEYLNVRDQGIKNLHAVIGFGLGGSFALRFACQRKRLRGAVAFYSQAMPAPSILNMLVCPVLCHRPEADAFLTDEHMEQLRQAGREAGKAVEVRTYPGAGFEFTNDVRKDSYRPDAARLAWDATIKFLNHHLTP